MVGDRSQRRRDVLETSTNLLHEGGWAALTMREVAARTGVSAGASTNGSTARTRSTPNSSPHGSTCTRSTPCRTISPSTTSWPPCSGGSRPPGSPLPLATRLLGDPPRCEPGQARLALSEAYRHILEVGSVKLQAAAEREGRRFLDDLDTTHDLGNAAGIAQRAVSRWRRSGSIR